MNTNFLNSVTNFLKKRTFEFFGLILILTSIGLAIAFSTYSPADPSFVYGNRDFEIQNFFGIYGSGIADFFLHSFGLVSFLLLANNLASSGGGTYIRNNSSVVFSNVTIANNTASGTTNSIAVSASEVIEAVQLKMNVTHTFTGCMGVELVSPAGTKSVLAHPYNIFWNTDDWDNYVLLTNAFYGESTNGNWTVRVLDGCTAAFSGVSGAVVENWSIRFFEH